MVPYSRRMRAITGVRSGDFRLSAHAPLLVHRAFVKVGNFMPS